MYALALLSIDLIQRVLELRHRVDGAGIQGLLHYRLLGICAFAKDLL